MRRRALTALFLTLLGPGLVACATTSPVSPATPSGTPTAVVPTVSATPGPIPTPTPTATATTPTVDTTAPTAGTTTLVLRGDGLGTFAFGSRQADVTSALEDALGEPDESSQGIRCQLDDASPWAQTVSWGSFWVEYDAKDSSKKAPRTLVAWGLSATAPPPARLAVQDDVPLTLTFSQLKAKYPSGKLQDLGLGDGSKRFILPNKIFFVGAGNRPVSVQAGVFSTCE